MCFWYYSNSLVRTLFYSNTIVSLCIKQGSKINYNSVSVEELDWSAESQVLIPAEHLWCDFKCRSFAKNSSPNTLYIHHMDKSTGTPPSLDEKKPLPNCGNKDGNIIHVLNIFISTSVATGLKCMKWLYPYVHMSLVILSRHFCCALRIHARADIASIRLYTRTACTESASLYVISAMTPATMCRGSATLYGADALKQATLLRALIFHTL